MLLHAAAAALRAAINLRRLRHMRICSARAVRAPLSVIQCMHACNPCRAFPLQKHCALLRASATCWRARSAMRRSGCQPLHAGPCRRDLGFSTKLYTHRSTGPRGLRQARQPPVGTAVRCAPPQGRHWTGLVAPEALNATAQLGRTQPSAFSRSGRTVLECRPPMDPELQSLAVLLCCCRLPLALPLAPESCNASTGACT